MTKVKNYARFYSLLNNIQTPCKHDLKEQLVSQFTDGRTASLREMSQTEYAAMCDSIDTNKQEDKLKTLRKLRSNVLLRLQKIGLDTSSWSTVNAFCENPRIAGKEFRKLSPQELQELVPKLEAMLAKQRKDAKKKSKPAAVNSADVVQMTMSAEYIAQQLAKQQPN